MSNQTFFDNMTQADLNSLVDNIFFEQGLSTIREGIKVAFECACSTLGTGFNPQPLIQKTKDINLFLRFYFCERLHEHVCVHDPKLAPAQRTAHIMVYALIAKMGIEWLCEQIEKTISEASIDMLGDDAEGSRRKNTLVTNVRKLGVLGIRLVGEFNRATSRACDPDFRMYQQLDWPYEFEITAESFMLGFVHDRSFKRDGTFRRDGVGGMRFHSSDNSMYLPASHYTLCLLRPLIETAISLRTLNLEVGTGERSNPDGTVEPAISDSLEFLLRTKNIDEMRMFDTLLSIHQESGILTENERSNVGLIYKVASETIHKGRFYESGEVIMFYRYINALPKLLEERIVSIGKDELTRRWNDYMTKHT